MHNYEPDKILNSDEYDEITNIVYERVKDQLDGKPMYFVEEYEEENIPNEGENYEEQPKKIISQRKVFINFKFFKKYLKKIIFFIFLQIYTINKKYAF